MTHIRHPDITTHPLIAKLAVEMAQTVYEEVCSGSNAIYKVQGDRDDFVRQCAPTLKAAAKQTLAAMLADPKVCDAEKETIYEALVMDNGLPKGGTSVISKKLLK